MIIKQSLYAIEDTLGGSKTVAYTFFGDATGVYTDEMIPYMGTINSGTLSAPFIVQMELPSSYYFSNSQPAPIEYYIKQNSRWTMFSMDFLNGKYAQTLLCRIEDPNYQSLRELLTFFIGIFSTLSITFGLEVWTKQREKKDKEKTNFE